MRAVIQRVKNASVSVAQNIISEINSGLLVFLGVEQSDTEADCSYMAEKIANLRIFEDADGKMNLSVMDIRGSILIVSQFTLLGDVRRGRRPSFTSAMEPDQARILYERCAGKITEYGILVRKGSFREMMQIELCNDGPVTILIDSKKIF
jgi:D-tyrosyl-tRNA(Tyr) deacylase